jgi:hypothetical protein
MDFAFLNNLFAVSTINLCAILGLFAALVAVTASSNNDEFLHFGPGTTPENTPNFLHKKIDKWAIWTLVMTISAVFVIIAQMQTQVIKNFKTQVIMSKAVNIVEYKDRLRTFGIRENWALLATKYLSASDAVVLPFLGIIPVLIYTTGQFQYMIPGVVVTVLLSYWGTMKEFRDKT